MHEHLTSAIELAESVRYSGDHRRVVDRVGTLQSSNIHYQFNENGLRVAKEVTPGLYDILDKVCQRLNIETDDIMAFVYASPEINAGCYSADTRDCLISMTSGLVSLMCEEELAFVIGHELGHFLLGHGAAHSGNNNSTEGLMAMRAMEISADRVGLLACPTKNAAFRALVKTTSGLDDSFLRFDINTFLDQVKGNTNSSSSDSTHPSIIYRCRSLLWFEMSDPFKQHNGLGKGDPMDKVNARVEKDMQAFVDGPAKQRIKDAEESMHIWMTTAAAVREGSFTKQAQEHISNQFGPDYLGKLVSLFSGCGKSEVRSIVRDKLSDSMRYFESVAPQKYNEAYPNF